MKPILTFSKQIKSTRIAKKSIPDDSSITKISAVLGNLLAQPKSKVSDVEDIGLRTNPKKWITALLTSFPGSVEASDAEDLLFDFTETMQTRMREDAKYALALLMENNLFICHSVYGEETITPEWKIIPRMLDSDNVLRFASFYMDEGVLLVRYWERNATSSFIDWLGLPRKEAFEFGGTYRIISRIQGASLELHLTEQEIDEWITNHPELRTGTIDFSEPLNSLIIEEIRAGRKQYDRPEDFIQDFEAEKKGVPKYQREYERIMKTALPLLIKYFDEQHQVVTLEGDDRTIQVEKDTQGFDVIFANGTIEFRASYISDLAKRMISGDEINMYHAGHDFGAEPIQFGNIHIFNRIRQNHVSKELIVYAREIKLNDQQLNLILKLAILDSLALANEDAPIGYAISELKKESMSQSNSKGKITKLEDGVLEYKSRDLFSGSNDEVIEKVSTAINRILASSPTCILLLGVEDDGSIDPIPSSRIQSDRLEIIRVGVSSELETDHVSLLAIPSNAGSIVLFYANTNSE